MARWSPLSQRTELFIALSQLACLATLGALLAASWQHSDRLLNGTFVASLGIFALAAGGIALRTRRLPRLLFAGFAAAAALLTLAEILALLIPHSGLAAALHLMGDTEKAIFVATLNTLLPLYAQAAQVAQRRAAEALETSVVAERTFAATLEASVAVRTAELEDTQRVLQRMWRLGQQISLELDPTRVLERFVDAASDIAQADGAAIGLMGEDATVRVSMARGALVNLAGAQVPAGECAMGRVIRTGTPWVADDVHGDPSADFPFRRLATGTVHSVAVLPISRRGERVGAVMLVRLETNPFTEVTLSRVNSMGDLLNVALENAELVETLRQAEWRFRTLFRSAPDAVFTVLRSGRIREANDAAADLLGVETVRLVGRRFGELVVDDDRDRIDEALAATFAGRAARLEISFRREAGGPSRLVSFAASLLPEADPPTVLVVARDVTAERDMRVRLMQSDRLAAVGELVAGVAHEVNNPLSSISAYAQLLLRDERLDGALREQVEVIRSETMRASQVVKDLLAFARRTEPRHEPLDLNMVVARTLRMRAYQLSSGRIVVQQSLEEGLAPVIGDARQLQQVCLNLVTNATQAMAGAGGAGGALTVTTRSADGTVVLEIADTGPGIPAELRNRVFEPFFTTKKEGEGTGLGLSVSYGIVTAHEGRIEIAQTSPRGTTFRVTLPAAEATVAGGAVAEPPLVLRSPIAGTRLLFVDDEPAICGGVTAYARARGFTVITASSGEAALEILRETNVDAVVCDIRMPGMDGFAFHNWLRLERPGLATRTVFITGDVVTASSRRTVRQPMLAKPFTFERLEASVTAVIQGRPFDEGRPTPIHGTERIP
ncbi:MAG: PAS domain S-box protein [Gemmatimonadota bacterium]|nr:PAS domain S-box protein [Gemmatimonadota bacterium]